MQTTVQEPQTAVQRSVDTLNTLLKINNSRIEGYERAYKLTDEPDLKHLFFKLNETSYACRQELITEVKRMGGVPEETAPANGRLLRIWMSIKASLTKKDRKTILSSCESLQDVTVANYENALKK